MSVDTTVINLSQAAVDQRTREAMRRIHERITDDMTAADVRSVVRWVLDLAHGRMSVPGRVMGWLDAEMARRGMLCFDPPLPPPDLSRFGTDVFPMFESFLDKATPDAARKAIWDYLAQQPDGDGIAAFKIRSNDWWIVTPAELESALGKLDGQPALDDPLWIDWVELLHLGAEFGGLQIS